MKIKTIFTITFFISIILLPKTLFAVLADGVQIQFQITSIQLSRVEETGWGDNILTESSPYRTVKITDTASVVTTDFFTRIDIPPGEYNAVRVMLNPVIIFTGSANVGGTDYYLKTFSYTQGDGIDFLDTDKTSTTASDQGWVSMTLLPGRNIIEVDFADAIGNKANSTVAAGELRPIRVEVSTVVNFTLISGLATYGNDINPSTTTRIVTL